MQKKTKKSGKKWILFVGIAVVLIGVGYFFVYPMLQANASSGVTIYKTQAVKKGDLSSTVGATGNVYTRQTVSLSWKTSGIVSKVGVTKGQEITAGTVLAELDENSLPDSAFTAASDLAKAQKTLDDLLNSNTDRANAELALLEAEGTLVSAQKASQSKLYQRASQSTIDTARANMIQAQAALDQAADAYNKNKNRSSDDVQYAAALSRFAAAQQTFDNAQMNYEYVQALPSALAVQKASAEVDVAQAAYQDAKRAWERVKDGPNAADVAAAEANVAAAQAVIDQAHIDAPISGTITAIDTQVGDLVSAGDSAFQIDDLSHLYVDISVSEVDINQVKMEQPVEITFDAIPDKTYTGTVTDIATMGITSSGAVNFYVTVEITDKDSLIRAGMTASANIVVTQKTGVLLVPSSAIRTVNSQQVVYVMQNNLIRSVVITTGDTDTSSTEVVSGNLIEGDMIVLNPSSTTTDTMAETRAGGLFGGLFGGIFGGGGGPSGGMPPSGGPGGGPGGSSSSSGASRGSSSSSSGGSDAGAPPMGGN